MRFTRLLPLALAPLFAMFLNLLTGLSPSSAGEIGFMEQFVLAPDRSVVLSQLVPGTEDYYYYHCLHYQNLQQYDRVEELLAPWIERYKDTPRNREIRNRQALLTYGENPQGTLQYLTQALGLRFDHQRDTVDRASQLPARLDPALLSRERLRAVGVAARPKSWRFRRLRPALAGTDRVDGRSTS